MTETEEEDPLKCRSCWREPTMMVLLSYPAKYRLRCHCQNTGAHKTTEEATADWNQRQADRREHDGR